MSLAVSLAMMAGMAWFFRSSKYGLAMRATAFDQQVAQSLGVLGEDACSPWPGRSRRSSRRWPASSWRSSTASRPGLSAYGIKVFPAVILGGLDSIAGAVIGGIIIGLLENLAHFVDSQYLHWGNLYEIAPFYVLIIILMIKPYGLFGTKDIERIDQRSRHGDQSLLPAGDFRTTYAADTVIFPTVAGGAAAIASVALLCFAPLGAQPLLAQPPDPDRLSWRSRRSGSTSWSASPGRSRSGMRPSSASAHSPRPI